MDLSQNPFDRVHLQWFAADDLVFGDEDEVIDGEEEAESEGEADDQQQAQEAVEEMLFAILGEDGKEQQLPFKKLSPDHVKPWYEAHRNQKQWQTENTKKSQEVADQRREFEAEQAKHKAALDQLENWTGYFRANHGLQELVSAFVQGRIPQNVLEQIIGQQAQQGAQGRPAGQQQPTGYNPYLDQVTQRLAALEKSIQEDRQKRLQQEQLTEREKAIQTVLPSIPEDQREAFQQYMEQATGNLSSLEDMYKLVANAYMWDKNRETIVKQAEQKTLENIQKKKAAAVETGTQQSAVSLPSNVDLSESRDLGRLFEKFGEEVGAYE